MTVTKLANLVNPEVLADMVSASVLKNIKFLALAEVDTTLAKGKGSVLTLPKYEYIGDAVNVPEGEEIPMSMLSTSTTHVEVGKAGRGVDITDEAVLSGYGDPIGEAERQLTKAITQKVDFDIFTALGGVNEAMVSDLSTEVISANVVADALVKFGEDLGGKKVLFINPAQFATIRKDENFIKVTELAERITNDVVGEIWGCQIILSNRVAKDEVNGTYKNLVVKPGAVGLLIKRETEIETDRNIQRKTTGIVADQHYAVYLKDESKVTAFTVKA